jgi:hypothetical protein
LATNALKFGSLSNNDGFSRVLRLIRPEFRHFAAPANRKQTNRFHGIPATYQASCRSEALAIL